MARPLRIEYDGAIYHITSRGNEGKGIYRSDRDKERFLEYLKIIYDRHGVKIHAYCLMTNHYHLIVETPRANLSRCMQMLNSSYTTYYNTKRKRRGHLFQGRYKAILVDKESYLRELTRYVHLNPVRAKIVTRPEEHKWSSYSFYIKKKKIPEYMEIDFTLSYFGGSGKRYKDFIDAGIETEVRDIFEDLKAGFILGDSDFVEKIREEYLGEVDKTEDLPELRKLEKEYRAEDKILDCLNGDPESEKLTVYYLRRYTDKTLQEIIKTVYGKSKSSSSVSKIVSRIEAKRRKDKRFDQKLEVIEKSLSMSRSDP